jgi:hypothetical protein
MTSSEIELATFGVVAYCLNRLGYRVPQLPEYKTVILVFQEESRFCFVRPSGELSLRKIYVRPATREAGYPPLF